MLFLNAGVAPMRPFAEYAEEDFDRVFSTNVKSPFFTVQKALPLLAEGASIIFKRLRRGREGPAGGHGLLRHQGGGPLASSGPWRPSSPPAASG